jgi:dolichyl-phosphate beta-glucosyltransferase
MSDQAQSEAPYLSVVIPAYNEERRLPATCRGVGEYLEQAGYPYEVILVDDGSTDSTPVFIRAIAAEVPGFRGVFLPSNRGKGAAVRAGMATARGEHLLFSDSDLSTPIEEVRRLSAALEERQAGVAIASRRLAGAHLVVRQPLHRRVMGTGFSLLTRTVALPGLYDTQCGFKLFTRQAAQAIFPRLTIARFGFDVEALYLARRLGYRVVEVPVTWQDSRESKVNPLRDSARMFGDLARIRWNDLAGRYR